MENEGAKRNPEEIERDIAETRVEIDSTVDELGERLAPRRLVGEAADYARETVARGASDVWARTRDIMRDNAVPFALIGTGVVWFMATRSGTTGGAYDGYQTGGRAERYGRGAQTSDVGRAVHGAGAELGDRAHQQLRQQTDRARRRLDDIRYEQPLLLGLVSLAAGALVGGSLPSTRREDELLGETRDQLVETAAEASKEKVEQVRRTAEETLHQTRKGEAEPGQPAQQS